MAGVVKWDPWREMEDLFDRYNRAVVNPRQGGQEVVASGDWAPRVDIAETSDAFIIKAEIPEVHKDDVKVVVDNGVLTIRGERKHEAEQSDKKFHRIERFYGTFVRSFTLPDNADPARITANFKDGLLVLNIAKSEAAKPKVIEVQVD